MLIAAFDVYLTVKTPLRQPLQIHQDTIRDLLARSAGASRAVTPRGSGTGLGGGTGGGAAGATPRLIAYRDPDPTKDILLVGLEEVKVG